MLNDKRNIRKQKKRIEKWEAKNNKKYKKETGIKKLKTMISMKVFDLA